MVTRISHYVTPLIASFCFVMAFFSFVVLLSEVFLIAPEASLRERNSPGGLSPGYSREEFTSWQVSKALNPFNSFIDEVGVLSDYHKHLPAEGDDELINSEEYMRQFRSLLRARPTRGDLWLAYLELRVRQGGFTEKDARVFANTLRLNAVDKKNVHRIVEIGLRHWGDFDVDQRSAIVEAMNNVDENKALFALSRRVGVEPFLCAHGLSSDYLVCAETRLR